MAQQFEALKRKALDDYTAYLDSLFFSREALHDECEKVGIIHIKGVPLNGRHGTHQLYTALMIHKLNELDQTYPEAPVDQVGETDGSAI